MPTLTEGKHTGEFLISTANGDRSMETGTLVTGFNVEPGTILGEQNAPSGNFTPVQIVAFDGTEIGVGIAFDAADSTAESKPIVLVKRDAVVRESDLIFPAAATPAQIETIKGHLNSLGIIVR